MLKISKWFYQKKQYKLYTTCNTLPIHSFNEIASNGDFSYLKKNKEDIVSNEVLQAAWIDILDEYITISDNKLTLMALTKKAKVMLLEKRLHVLEVMKFCTDRGIDIDAELKAYRIKKDKIQANIGLVKNDINRYSDIQPTERESKSSNTDFDRSIAMLNKNGFNINRFTTVVSEWVQALNILEQQNKANKQ